MRPRKDRERAAKELLQRLTQIAAARGLPPAQAEFEAIRTRARINRAIEAKRADIFRWWHYDAKLDAAGDRTAVSWIEHLVKLERKPARRGALSPVERRAVELLTGGRRKPLKNTIEGRAITLAGRITAKWSAPGRQRGRPKGSHAHPGEMVFDRHNVPLTVADVVAVVVPLIEEHATRTASGRRGRIGAAIRAAVGLEIFALGSSVTRAISAYLTAVRGPNAQHVDRPSFSDGHSDELNSTPGA